MISYNDPHVARLRKTRQYDFPLESRELTAEFLASQDCVLIVTDHSAYDYDFIVRHSNLVLDTRNATEEHAQQRKDPQGLTP